MAGPLLPARFVARPNRFLTVIELAGGLVEAHLPDPGRLRELLTPGVRVWARAAAGGARRTQYTLTLVEAPSGELVSLVATYANDLVEHALAAGRIGELAGWRIERREYRWGSSRFDFLLACDGGEERMLLEVKSVTLVEDGCALFPDAVTARGTRHVTQLARSTEDGYRATVIFVVQRADAASVTAARSIDPVFANALAEARDRGVSLLGYRCRVTMTEAKLTEPIPVHVGTPGA
jgi:sugar fermentation stimulation protein A